MLEELNDIMAKRFIVQNALKEEMKAVLKNKQEKTNVEQTDIQ